MKNIEVITQNVFSHTRVMVNGVNGVLKPPVASVAVYYQAMILLLWLIHCLLS